MNLDDIEISEICQPQKDKNNMQQQLARPLPSKFDKVILVGNVEGMTIISRPCVSHSFKARFNQHGNLVFKVKYKEMIDLGPKFTNYNLA